MTGMVSRPRILGKYMPQVELQELELALSDTAGALSHCAIGPDLMVFIMEHSHTFSSTLCLRSVESIIDSCYFGFLQRRVHLNVCTQQTWGEERVEDTEKTLC